jgi:hypothetical protein
MVNSSDGNNDAYIAQFTQQSNCSKIKRHKAVLEQVFTVVTQKPTLSLSLTKTLLDQIMNNET